MKMNEEYVTQLDSVIKLKTVKILAGATGSLSTGLCTYMLSFLSFSAKEAKQVLAILVNDELLATDSANVFSLTKKAHNLLEGGMNGE